MICSGEEGVAVAVRVTVELAETVSGRPELEPVWI